MQHFVEIKGATWETLKEQFPWFDLCDYLTWKKHYIEDETASLYLYEENGKDVVLFLWQDKKEGERYIPFIYWNPQCKPGSYAHFLAYLQKEFGKGPLRCVSYNIQPMWGVRLKEAGAALQESGKTVQLMTSDNHSSSDYEKQVLDHRGRQVMQLAQTSYEQQRMKGLHKEGCEMWFRSDYVLK